jgi:hypothetical protein
MSRTEQREGFPPEVRIRLLEGDMDEVATGMAGVRRLLQGLLVTTASGSIFLALNLVVGTLGG